MKITKTRLTEIIKGVIAEEAYDCEQDYRMGGMTYEEYKQCLADAEDEEGGYYEEGVTNEGSANPMLVKSWVRTLEKFITPELIQDEAPEIIAALEQLRAKIGDISSKQEFRQ